MKNFDKTYNKIILQYVYNNSIPNRYNCKSFKELLIRLISIDIPKRQYVNQAALEKIDKIVELFQNQINGEYTIDTLPYLEARKICCNVLRDLGYMEQLKDNRFADSKDLYNNNKQLFDVYGLDKEQLHSINEPIINFLKKYTTFIETAKSTEDKKIYGKKLFYLNDLGNQVFNIPKGKNGEYIKFRWTLQLDIANFDALKRELYAGKDFIFAIAYKQVFVKDEATYQKKGYNVYLTFQAPNIFTFKGMQNNPPVSVQL